MSDYGGGAGERSSGRSARHLERQAIGAEPDPACKLAIYARAVREIQARMAPLVLVLRERVGDRTGRRRGLAGDQ